MTFPPCRFGLLIFLINTLRGMRQQVSTALFSAMLVSLGGLFAANVPLFYVFLRNDVFRRHKYAQDKRRRVRNED